MSNDAQPTYRTEIPIGGDVVEAIVGLIGQHDAVRAAAAPEAAETADVSISHLLDTLDARERAIAIAYAITADGFADCFDVVEADHFREAESDSGFEAAQAEARGHFTTLRAWYQALDSLYGDLASGPGQRHSIAARQVVQHEANRFFHTLNLVRREVCTWLLGTAGPQPEIDAGVLTFCDVPPRIHLDGTALAESA